MSLLFRRWQEMWRATTGIIYYTPKPKTRKKKYKENKKKKSGFRNDSLDRL